MLALKPNWQNHIFLDLTKWNTQSWYFKICAEWTSCSQTKTWRGSVQTRNKFSTQIWWNWVRSTERLTTQRPKISPSTTLCELLNLVFHLQILLNIWCLQQTQIKCLHSNSNSWLKAVSQNTWMEDKSMGSKIAFSPSQGQDLSCWGAILSMSQVLSQVQTKILSTQFHSQCSSIHSQDSR